MKIQYMVLFVGIMFSLSLNAETIEIDCPRVEVDNPYNIKGNPTAGGWEQDTVAKSHLNCRKHINPQGYLKCTYKPSAHSTVSTYALKRLPPENSTCKEKTVGCGFACTKNFQKISPKLKVPVPKLKK